MSKFDATYRLSALIFFTAILAVAPAYAAMPQGPPDPAPDQPAQLAQPVQHATPATDAPQSAPTQPSTEPVPPSSPAESEVSGNPPLRYVISAPPPTPEQIGDSMSVRQRYQAAIAAYTKATPMTPVIWNKMGIAYQMMFAVRDAIRCYNASLKLDPKNAQVINNLATVYDSQKQFGQAEKLYRKALKIDPKSALIHRNLGSNLMAQHKYKKGSESYRAALAIDPHIFSTHSGASVQNPASAQDRGALHYYMARGCVSAGNSECAIQNLRLALNEGYTNVRKIVTDESFASIRELPGFQQLIASQTAQ
jgi:tetratricopeptide (TPR) repeat protein